MIRAIGARLVTLLHLIIIAACIYAYMHMMGIRTDLATGWVDSAIYHALFLDAQAIQQRFGDVYFLARWPWILTGQFFYEQFPLATASFALTCFVSWVYGAGLYLLARQFVHWLPALVIGILGCCNLYITQTIVSGYPSAAACALLLWGVAFNVSGNRSGQLWKLAIGGVLYALAALTQNWAVVFGVAIHIVLLISRFWDLPWRTMVKREAVTVIAAVAMVPLSIPVFYAMGSSEDAFNSLLITAQHAANGQGEFFSKTSEQLLLDSGALILFATAIVAVIASLGFAGWRWKAIPQQHRTAHLIFLVPFSIGMLYDVLFGGVTLQYGFYQIFHCHVAMLQFAVLLSLGGKASRINFESALALVLIVTGTLFATLKLMDGGIDTRRVFEWIIVASSVFSVLLLFTILFKKRFHAGGVIVILFVATVCFSANFSNYSLMAHEKKPSGAQSLETLQWVMDIADKYANPKAPLFLAYDRDHLRLNPQFPITNDRWYFTFRGKKSFLTIYDTLAGASLWARGLVATTSEDMTLVALERLLDFQGKATVLIMWQNENIGVKITDVLEEKGIKADVLYDGVYNSEKWQFKYTVYVVVKYQ